MSQLPLISDDELLALVEQRPIAPERQSVLRQALANDPALVRTIRAMRQDMLALQSLGESADAMAPADLLAGVEARLEREALLGLSTIREPDASPDTIPISSLQPRGRSMLDVVVFSPWSRRVAAAAAVALVAAAGYLTISPLLRSAPRNEVTKRPTSDPVVTPYAPIRGADPVLANANTAVDKTNATLADLNTGTEALAALVGPDPIAALSNASVTASVNEISMAQALAAAQDGRLVIRMHAARSASPATPETMTRRLATLSARSPISPLAPRLSPLAPEMSQQVASTVQSHHATLIARATRQPTAPGGPKLPNDPAFASAGITSAGAQSTPGVASGNEPVPALPAPAASPPSFDSQSVFIASILPTELSLAQLKRSLTSSEVAATFDILETTALPAASLAPTDAASIFWWNQPARTWSPRLTVPILPQLSN
ncbi:MAG: hypothetical protein K2X32_07370 [Phycisphaerales bacterium]|nr:hypothetical protein [Phycisphaerales bacterium]